jgi:RHS repeat-associated protein
MPTPYQILTLARTCVLALVYAWVCVCACIGMSINAWAIPHAHADTYLQSQSRAANATVAIRITITPTISTLGGASIARIDYFADTSLIGSVIDNTSGSNLPASGSPYNWSPLTARTYTVTAQVTDSIGHTATSAPITVTIANPNGETITFLHNDFAGSAIAATDDLGAVLWKENYTPFGDRAVKAVAGANNRQFFTGKPVDGETGLSYFGARYYDPVVGRFMGVDPLVFRDADIQSFNRYAYANNNPYKNIDPDGRRCTSASGTTTCDTGVAVGLPVVSFPTPIGFPATMGPEDKNHHLYDKTAIGLAENNSKIQQAIVNDPTPGKDQPATVQGTANNATPESN